MNREEIESGITEIIGNWIYTENSGAELTNNSAKYNNDMTVCCEMLEDGQIYVTWFDGSTWNYYATVSVIP